MESKAKLESNWLVRGDRQKGLQTKFTHEDIFIKPDLHDFVTQENAMLLVPPPNVSDPCEMEISINPIMKIESLSMVITASKLELFLGPQKEYAETVYGTAMPDPDDSDSDSEDLPPSYRYDIEITKSGITKIYIKLLTSLKEICVFGLMLQIAPNPNGITTLSPNAINLDNVADMLNHSNKKLSQNAEKCKLFMEMYSKTMAPSSSQAALQQMKDIAEKYSQQPIKEENNDIKKCENIPELMSSLEITLKSHIDVRLQQLERRINSRLDAFEVQQSAKLDKILCLLENDK